MGSEMVLGAPDSSALGEVVAGAAAPLSVATSPSRSPSPLHRLLKGDPLWPLNAVSEEGLVCFHVRNLECGESPAEDVGGDVFVDGAAVHCQTVCVQSTAQRPSTPQGPSFPAQGPPTPQGAPPPLHDSAARQTPRGSRPSFRPSSPGGQSGSVSISGRWTARRRFYASSLSGSELYQPIIESEEQQRHCQLQKKEVLRVLAASALVGWKGHPDEAISVETVSGGLSNQLYLLQLRSEQQQQQQAAGDSSFPRDAETGEACGSGGPLVTKALIRVFGNQEGTALFDSQAERKLFKALGNLGIAPKCLAEFEGGRIEAFWEGAPLTTTHLTDKHVLERVMKLISSFHAVQLSSMPSFSGFLSAHKSSEETDIEDSCTGCTCCLCRLELWGRIALEASDVALEKRRFFACFASQQQQQQQETAAEEGPLGFAAHQAQMLVTAEKLKDLSVEEQLSEAAWLAAQIRSLAASDDVYFRALQETVARAGRPAKTPEAQEALQNLHWLSGTFPVLSHNDLQENNIMHMKHGELKLIDFEYAGVNLRAFDLGNLFCEATLDYMANPKWPFYSYLPEQMASTELRRHLIQVYLEETLKSKGLSDFSDLLLTKETIDRFMKSVDYMMLASHMLWVFWSVVRTNIPQNPDGFSYLDYAKTRLDVYYSKKNEMQVEGLLP